ncbi:FoF1 ATP synthase subunit B' [Helicobacter cinaedi]|uniref:FoF1 ATP synthase subunit B' n=1 Tax=Helicobacter cinaedi TaxID=213 RepID=UPI000CF1417E|nr:FoF1 ATP synthase subunit B' [Helicobacter cinaedi]
MSITLNPYLMSLVFVTFILLIYLLNQWLFKPMMTFIDNRDASIERDLSSTQNHKGNIQRIDEEITQILSSARKEAAQILELATREAKATYEEKINAKKAENEKKLAESKQALQEQQTQLYAELLEQLPVFKLALDSKLKQI